MSQQRFFSSIPSFGSKTMRTAKMS